MDHLDRLEARMADLVTVYADHASMIITTQDQLREVIRRLILIEKRLILVEKNWE